MVTYQNVTSETLQIRSENVRAATEKGAFAKLFCRGENLADGGL